MNIRMNLGINSYDIIVERGVLAHAGEQLNLKRRVFIITDAGVPAQYAERIAAQCSKAHIETVKQGEGSKSIAVVIPIRAVCIIAPQLRLLIRTGILIRKNPSA